MPTAKIGVKLAGCGINLEKDKIKIKQMGKKYFFKFLSNLFMIILI